MNDSLTPAWLATTARLRVHVAVLLLGGGVLVAAAVSLWAWSPWKSAAEPAAQAIPAVAQQPVIAAATARALLDTRREQARRNPRDGRAWVLLAYSAFEADVYDEAASAFEKAVAASPRIASDPGVLCDWADALGMTHGGSLKGRPTELLSRALALDSNFPKALEMAGSAAYEERQFELAADLWRRLLPQMEQGSTGRRALEEGISRAERLAAMSPPVRR